MISLYRYYAAKQAYTYRNKDMLRDSDKNRIY